ncbi:reverse transcriptase domain-containing protein [Tanacetum coccineum]
MQNQMGQLAKALNERPQGVLPSNTIHNPQEDVKLITTWSGITLAGPSVLPPPPSSSSKEMFKKLHFNISLAKALALMPKYANILKDLLTNKENLLEMANTPLNENCSAIMLKKLPRNLETLGNFSFLLMLPELVPTRMTLELANWSVTYPAGIAEDVFMQVGKFMFPADFVVVDYDVDPRVPLILGRPFLRTARALVDVHEEELILRVGDEKLTFKNNSGSTTSHSDPSLLEYESFYFDIDLKEFEDLLYYDPSIDPPSITKRSDSHHEEFADEIAHIISPPEYDQFYFNIEADPRELTRLLRENISSKSVNLTKIKEDKELKSKTSTKKLTIHELNDLRLLLSNCDSTFAEEFSEIDPLVDLLFLSDPSAIETFLSFPSGNEDKVFNPGILFIDEVLSFTRKSPHLLNDNFKIDKRHILSEISLKTKPSVSFHPMDNGIRGDSSGRVRCHDSKWVPLADMANDVAATSMMTWHVGPTSDIAGNVVAVGWIKRNVAADGYKVSLPKQSLNARAL